jgi:hypothetical protein
MHPYEMRALQSPNLGQLHACCAVPRTLLCDAPCCMTSVACCTTFRAFATDRVTCALNIVSHAKPVCAWKSEVMLPICTKESTTKEVLGIAMPWTAVSHRPTGRHDGFVQQGKARRPFAEPPYMVQDRSAWLVFGHGRAVAGQGRAFDGQCRAFDGQCRALHRATAGLATVCIRQGAAHLFRRPFVERKLHLPSRQQPVLAPAAAPPPW